MKHDINCIISKISCCIYHIKINSKKQIFLFIYLFIVKMSLKMLYKIDLATQTSTCRTKAFNIFCSFKNYRAGNTPGKKKKNIKSLERFTLLKNP